VLVNRIRKSDFAVTGSFGAAVGRGDIVGKRSQETKRRPLMRT